MSVAKRVDGLSASRSISYEGAIHPCDRFLLAYATSVDALQFPLKMTMPPSGAVALSLTG